MIRSDLLRQLGHSIGVRNRWEAFGHGRIRNAGPDQTCVMCHALGVISPVDDVYELELPNFRPRIVCLTHLLTPTTAWGEPPRW